MKKALTIVMAVVMVMGFAGCEKVGEVIGDLTDGKVMDVFDKTAAIEETVLVDEGGIKITATDLVFDNYEAELILTIENHNDRAMQVLSGSGQHSCNSVNGYMTGAGYLNIDVEAGETIEDSMSFQYYDLQQYGITKIASIGLGFDIELSEYDDYNERILSEFFTEPIVIKTSIANDFDFSEDTFKSVVKNGALANEYEVNVEFYSEEELYNSHDVSIPFVTLIANSDGDATLLIDIENNSDEEREIIITDVYINGNLAYEGSAHTIVTANSRFVQDMYLATITSRYDGEVSDVNPVETMSFTFASGIVKYEYNRKHYPQGEKSVTINFPEPFKIPLEEDMETENVKRQKQSVSNEITEEKNKVKSEYKVPNLVGMTLEQAQSAVADTEFMLTIESQEYSSSFKENIIMEQKPEYGVAFDEPCEIRIVVSLGVETFEIEDYTRRDGDEAEAELLEKGMKVTIVRESNDEIPSGLVIRQLPTAGMQVSTGKNVTLTVSTGSDEEPIEVPNVIGLSQSAAKSILERSGLVVAYVIKIESDEVKGTVVRQIPNALSEAYEGDGVIIYISD